MKNKVFTDFEELINDLKFHAREHGKVKLLPCDNPVALDLGWVDVNSNTRWSITIKNYKSSNNYDDIALNAIRTHEGKMALCEHLQSFAEASD